MGDFGENQVKIPQKMGESGLFNEFLMKIPQKMGDSGENQVKIPRKMGDFAEKGAWYYRDASLHTPLTKLHKALKMYQSKILKNI